MQDVVNHIIKYIPWGIAIFVALWCIGMFANWVAHKCPQRFEPPEE